MKFLMLSLWFAFLANPWSPDAPGIYLPVTFFDPSALSSPSYSIVMEDEVMLFTDTQDTDDWTKVIQVFTPMGIKVLEVNSCHAQQCQTNLGSLLPGYYLAVLTTEKGFTHSKMIYVG